MYERLLITGGCGFIGTSLIEHLLQSYSVKQILVLDNFKEGTPADLAEVCEFTCAPAAQTEGKIGVWLVEGDVRDSEVTALCSRGMDAIVHLAANTGVPISVEQPRLDMESNIIGTFNMLEAARASGIKKFVFASSGAPAGLVEPPIHEELPPHPVSPYGASKLAGEGYCSAYYHSFGVNTVCLRFGNVFGPRSKKKGSIVAKFIRKALNGEVCEIYGDGTQTRDFIYIRELISAIVASLERDVGGETFQIASGEERAVEEVTEIIKASLARYGVTMEVRYGSTRIGDVRRNYADTSKAKNMLLWQADKGIDAGIDETVDYFVRVFGRA